MSNKTNHRPGRPHPKFKVGDFVQKGNFQPWHIYSLKWSHYYNQWIYLHKWSDHLQNNHELSLSYFPESTLELSPSTPPSQSSSDLCQISKNSKLTEAIQALKDMVNDPCIEPPQTMIRLKQLENEVEELIYQTSNKIKKS